jgi:hypothetical protein
MEASVELLSGSLRKLALRTLAPGERVSFCLAGVTGQALLALDRRLVLLKTGRAVGRPFGGSVASYEYSEIAEVSLEVGEAYAALEISPLRPRSREWWHWRVAVDDPLRAPDSLLVPSSRATELEPYVARLRDLVVVAREGSPRIVSELERLAALHAAGALSDEEFARSKRSVLSGRD